MEDNLYKGVINTIENIFEQISNEVKQIDFKKNLLKNLKDEVVDVKSIENVGLELTSFLEKLQLKIFHTLNSLEDSITQINADQGNAFKRLAKEITKCRTSCVVALSKCICSKYAENFNHWHSSSDNLSVVNCEILTAKFSAGCEIKCDHNNIGKEVASDNPPNNSSKKISLSLINKSSISQETDDEGWVDLLSKVIRTGLPLPKQENIKEENDTYNAFDSSPVDFIEINNDSFDNSLTEPKCSSYETEQLLLDVQKSSLISEESTRLNDKTEKNNSNDRYDSDKTEIVDASYNTVLSDHSYTRNSSSEDTRSFFGKKVNYGKEKKNVDHLEEKIRYKDSIFADCSNPNMLEQDYLGAHSLKVTPYEQDNTENVTQESSFKSTEAEKATICSDNNGDRESCQRDSLINEYVSPFSVATEKITSDEEDKDEIQNSIQSNTHNCCPKISEVDESLESLSSVSKPEEHNQNSLPVNNATVTNEERFSHFNSKLFDINDDISPLTVLELSCNTINQVEDPNSKMRQNSLERTILVQTGENLEHVDKIDENTKTAIECRDKTINKIIISEIEDKDDDSKTGSDAFRNNLIIIDSNEPDSEKQNCSKIISKLGLMNSKEESNCNPIQYSTDFQKSITDSESADSFAFDFNEIVLNPKAITSPSMHIKTEQLKLQDSKQTKHEPFEVESDIRDELLALLKEVTIPRSEKTFVEGTYTSSEQIDKNLEKQTAEKIFATLQDESFDDITDTEDTESCSGVFSDISGILGDLQDSKLVSEENLQDNLQNSLELKECYIYLERVETKDCRIVSSEYDSDNLLDRLCDLSSLCCKRRHRDSSESSVPNKKSKRIRKKQDGESGSINALSTSDTSLEITEKVTGPRDLGSELEEKMERYWAQQVINEFTNSYKQQNEDNSNENKEKKQIHEKNNSQTGHDLIKKPSTEEELKKKSWKDDPLLKVNFNYSDSSSKESDSSASKKKKKIAKSKNRYEHDTDFQIHDTTEQNDESDSDEENIAKLKFQSNLISPIKRNIPISDSSDSDSDIEFVSHKVEKPKKNDSSNSNDDSSSIQKGRRNIRALMSDELLAEGTQKARELETERINRLKNKKKYEGSLSQSFCSQSEDGETFILDVDEKTGRPLIEVHPKLTARLKPHQLDGVRFMWDSCYESLSRLETDPGSGCILAHCMGLGKTFQVLTLIHTLFTHAKTNTYHVLVVCPLSTVNNWKKEAKLAYKHVPNANFNFSYVLDAKDFPTRIDIVKSWYSKKQSVLVMGYEAYETLTNEIKLERTDERTMQKVLKALVDPGPDLVICDEGHLLKNKDSRKALALNKIRSKRRIVLTGTPLQNNLLEYFCMVQFVKPNLLGTIKEFKTNFINPISNGQYQDSTEGDIRLMHKRTHVLHKLLKSTIQRVEDTELQQYLPKMIDHAVFIQLNQVQVELYNSFSNLVQNMDNKKKNRSNFLTDFAVFQYICTHPQMLPIMEKQRHKKIKESDLITNDKDINPAPTTFGWWKTKLPPDSDKRIDYGNKMVVLKAIIEECEALGDKLLVFSQTLGELDLIEHFLKTIGTERCASWKKREDYGRLDGTVNPEKRTIICDNFNDKTNSKMRILLMSTKVGGLGLNLTAANRVVIMTVSWNPSYDTQSVFRVYRFGQKKPVYVYRLVSLGTMEEKVYQRAINKLATAHRVVDKHQISRHFKSVDLQTLYSCQPNADEERPTPNIPEDQMLAKLILNLPCIFSYQEHKALLENRPEDNLTESELASAWEEFRTTQSQKPQVSQYPSIEMPVNRLLPPINGPNYSSALNLAKSKLDNMHKKWQYGNIFNDTFQKIFRDNNCYRPPQLGSDAFQQMTGSSTFSTAVTTNIPNSLSYSNPLIPKQRLEGQLLPQKSHAKNYIRLPATLGNDYQGVITAINDNNERSNLPKFSKDCNDSSSAKKNFTISPHYIVKEKENNWIATKKNNANETSASSSSDVLILRNENMLNSSSNVSHPTTTSVSVVKQPLITKTRNISKQLGIENNQALKNSQNIISLLSESPPRTSGVNPLSTNCTVPRTTGMQSNKISRETSLSTNLLNNRSEVPSSTTEPQTNRILLNSIKCLDAQLSFTEIQTENFAQQSVNLMSPNKQKAPGQNIKQKRQLDTNIGIFNENGTFLKKLKKKLFSNKAPHIDLVEDDDKDNGDDVVIIQ